MNYKKMSGLCFIFNASLVFTTDGLFLFFKAFHTSMTLLLNMFTLESFIKNFFVHIINKDH